MEEDYYAILGVPRNATQAHIRKAYKKMAIRWHPDKNPDNKEEAQRRFQKISEAYDTLQNERSRAEYDRFGGRSASSFSDEPSRRRRPPRDARDVFAEFFGGRDPFASMFSAFGEDDDFFASPFSRRMPGTSERSRRGDSQRRGLSGFRGFGGSFFDDDFFGNNFSGGTSSFSSSSFSTSMGGGSGGRRVVRSVSTRTSTVTGPDGVTRTTTTRTTRHPDGRVETESNETESIEDRRRGTGIEDRRRGTGRQKYLRNAP